MSTKDKPEGVTDQELIARVRQHLSRSTQDWNSDDGWLGELADRLEAALEAALPSGVRVKPPFEFDRYVNGKLMAEGVTIERETTFEAAAAKAALIASRGANGETPVLVYQAPQPTYAEAVAPYAAAIRMIGDGIEQIFGPLASLESEEATLLRGPEPHHRAEGILEALQRVGKEMGRLKHDIGRCQNALAEAEAEIDRMTPQFVAYEYLESPVRREIAEARVAELEKALGLAIKTGSILLQNSEGCAVNHYGEDFQIHGMPGFLVDCRADLEEASAALRTNGGDSNG